MGLLKQMHVFRIQLMLRIMAILMMGSNFSQVVLIYPDLFLGFNHEICTKDSTAFCLEQYNGVLSYNCVITQIFAS